jgi:hypothetical protein
VAHQAERLLQEAQAVVEFTEVEAVDHLLLGVQEHLTLAAMAEKEQFVLFGV